MYLNTFQCIWPQVCLSGHSKRRPKLGFKTEYCLLQVKSIAECSPSEYSKGDHSAILLTFIKLPFVIKSFVLSIFEWPLKTGFIRVANDEVADQTT